MNLGQLVSESEGLKLAANYRVSCYLQNKPFTQAGLLSIIEQLAHARYLASIMHLCMQGEYLVDLDDDNLMFTPAPKEVQEKLKEEYGTVLLFQSMEDNEDVQNED